MADDREGQRISSWGELFLRTVELGLGAATLTADTAQRLVNDLVGRGQVAREESQGLVDRLMSMGREQREMLTDMIDKATERAMIRMDVARRSDVDALARRVEILEAELQGRAQPRPAAPRAGEPIQPLNEADQDLYLDQD